MYLVNEWIQWIFSFYHRENVSISICLYMFTSGSLNSAPEKQCSNARCVFEYLDGCASVFEYMTHSQRYNRVVLTDSSKVCITNNRAQAANVCGVYNVFALSRYALQLLRISHFGAKRKTSSIVAYQLQFELKYLCSYCFPLFNFSSFFVFFIFSFAMVKTLKWNKLEKNTTTLTIEKKPEVTVLVLENTVVCELKKIHRHNS